MDDAMPILSQVYAAIQERDRSVLARGERWRPGGILERHEHLLHLIERALRAGAGRALPSAAVCHGCFYLTPTGFCPHRGRCVVQQHADTVVRAIATAMNAR
jgi:hypothetical protein